MSLLQNQINIYVNANGELVPGSAPTNFLYRNNLNRNVFFIVTPLSEAAVVKLIFKNTSLAKQGYTDVALPTQQKGSNITNENASYYDTVKDWNVFKCIPNETILAKFPSTVTGTIALTVSIKEPDLSDTTLYTFVKDIYTNDTASIEALTNGQYVRCASAQIITAYGTMYVGDKLVNKNGNKVIIHALWSSSTTEPLEFVGNPALEDNDYEDVVVGDTSLLDSIISTLANQSLSITQLQSYLSEILLGDKYLPLSAGTLINGGNLLIVPNGDIVWEDGYYYYSVNGNKNSNAQYAVSQKINILPYAGKSMRVYTKMENNVGICFWDKDDNFISGVNGVNTNTYYDFVIPKNAKYIGISCSNIDNAEDNVNGYTRDLFEEIMSVHKEDNVSINDKVDDGTIDILKNEDITWEAGYYYYYKTGVKNSISASTSSVFKTNIEKCRNKTIRVYDTIASNFGIVFFDKDDKFIYGVNGIDASVEYYDIFVPNNAKYIGISCLTAGLKNVKIILNDSTKYYADKYSALPQTITQNRYINRANGNEVIYKNANFSCSNFIDISFTKKIYLFSRNANSTDGYAFYNSQKGFISGGTLYGLSEGLQEVSVPEGAVYFRYTYYYQYGTSDLGCPSCVFVDTNDKVGRIGVQAEKSMMSVAMFNTIAGCGDSFTACQIYDYTAHTVIGDFPNLSWASILARKNGMTASIFATSGDNTRSYLTRTLPRLLADTAKDLYVFALGINDKDQEIPVGSLSDIHDDYTQNADTFYGNYGKILSQVITHAPNAKILLAKSLLPFDSAYYDYISTAIEEIADHFGIGYLETKGNVFLTSANYVNGRVHGHPTPSLQSGMATAFEEMINQLMEDEYDYFASYVPR